MFSVFLEFPGKLVAVLFFRKHLIYTDDQSDYCKSEADPYWNVLISDLKESGDCESANGDHVYCVQDCLFDLVHIFVPHLVWCCFVLCDSILPTLNKAFYRYDLHKTYTFERFGKNMTV